MSKTSAEKTISLTEIAKKFKTKRELLFDIAKWMKTDPSVIYANVTDDDAIEVLSH